MLSVALPIVFCLFPWPKKIPVVPVSYHEKIRVGRSEIYFFLNFFSCFWRFFAGRFVVESRHRY